MSSNANWKIIGANSGNMSRHRNVKAGKLNYEDGKWQSIYDVSGNKKIVYDISNSLTNQNVVVGIGTSSPFSRLSLGSNTGDGTVGNETTIGQIAAIALHENADGKKFHGFSYITDISRSNISTTSTPVNALALYSNTSTENISLLGAKVYVTDDSVLRIGGVPRTGPTSSSQGGGAGSTEVYPSVKLDVSGSIQVDGFISFCNLDNNDQDNVANATFSGSTIDSGLRKIPTGAIWVGKNTNVPGAEPALYMQGAGGVRKQLATTSGSGGGTVEAEVPWDFSNNNVAGRYIYNAIPDGTARYASNITITGHYTGSSYETFPKQTTPDAEFSRNFINALSVRGGNVAISSVDTFNLMGGNILIPDIGPNKKPIQAGYNATQLGLSGETLDLSSGVLFIEKQLLIGTSLPNGSTAAFASKSLAPKAFIDISGGTPYPVPGIMIGHGIQNSTTSTDPVPRATNSIIIGKLGDEIIGKTAINGDVKNSFIIGEENQIDTGYTSIIIGNTNKIADSSGNLLVLGRENGSTAAIKATNSIIVGYKNNVSSSFAQYSDTTKGGNLVFGEENVYTSEDTTPAPATGNNNIIVGKGNKSNATEYSFIQGKSNRTYGKELTVIGNSNKVGIDRVAATNATLSYHKVQNCFVHGTNNQILGPSGTNLLGNVCTIGYENMIDMSGNQALNTADTFILLGSYADISGRGGLATTPDSSNVKFAFGSHNMWTARGGNATVNGNVFTIDHSGNTHIHGNLIVDGSQVILRTEYFDVSDNNLTLNSAGNDPSGGGFTILDSAGSGDPHVFKWVGSAGTDGSFNTGTADLSTNNMFVGGKLTVTGLIDPTGLVLDTQGSTPAQIASKATLWFDGSDLYFNIGTGGNQKIGTTGGGAGSGMTEWIAAATNGTNQTIDAANTTLTFESSDTAFLTVTTAASRKIQYGVKEGGASTVLTTTSGNALSWGTVTNAMLANSKVTIGTTDVDLGAAETTLTGLASVTSTSFTGALTGNADTVTNGVYTTNKLSALATTTSSELAGVISDKTGTGSLVFATSPTLVTPALGTPASGILTNCNGTAAGLTVGAATTAVNISLGAVGDLPYQTAANTTALLAANTTTTKKFLTETGSGSVGQAPAWASIQSTDIPDEAVTYAKMQHADANTILVRDANSSGDISAKEVTDTQILIGNGAGFTAAALSGDVTMTNAGVCTIPQGTVGVHDLTHVAGTTVVVRNHSTAGPLDAVAVGDSQFLIGTESNGFVVKDLSGDVTMTLDGINADAVVTIANDAVTYAKMQDTTTNNRVLGAATAGTIGEVQVSNDMLVNKKVTIGSTDVDLGATVTTFAGLTLTTPIISSISNTGTITLPTTTGTLGLLGQVATGVDTSTINLVSAAENKSFTTANIFTDVKGDGTNALNITNPIVGGLIIVTETGSTDALVTIDSGTAVTATASASSVIIITGANAAVKIFDNAGLGP